MNSRRNQQRKGGVFMKAKYYVWLLALFFTLGTFALPAVAQAKYMCRGTQVGTIYNSEDGKYYPVPGTKSCMVYRAVDDKYYPVAKSGYCCRHVGYHKYACRHKTVAVVCQERPVHWMFGHWYPASNECWYRY